MIEPESLECPCGCGEMVRIGEDRTERLDISESQRPGLKVQRLSLSTLVMWLLTERASYEPRPFVIALSAHGPTCRPSSSAADPYAASAASPSKTVLAVCLGS